MPWWLAGSTSLFVTALVAAALVATWASLTDWRVASIAFGMAVIMPGIVGENWGWIAFAALLVVCVALVGAPAERQQRLPGRNFLPLLLILEGTAFGSRAILGTPPLEARFAFGQLALYWLVGLCLYFAYSRPRLVFKALRGLTWLLAFNCSSYLISLVAGFPVGSGALQLPYRQIEVFWPATATSGYASDLGSNLPRYIGFSGEPGLAAVFFLVAIWFTLRFERGLTRTLLLALLVSGSVFAQSTGLYISLVVLVVGTLLKIGRRLGSIPLTLIAIGLLPSTVWLLNALLTVKAQRNVTSLFVRGVSPGEGGGLRPSEAEGSISLLAALAKDPVLAIPLLVLIGFLVIVNVREKLTLGLVLAVAATGLFAQPLQVESGTWLLLVSAALIAERAVLSERDRMPQSRIGAGHLTAQAHNQK